MRKKSREQEQENERELGLRGLSFTYKCQIPNQLRDACCLHSRHFHVVF